MMTLRKLSVPVLFVFGDGDEVTPVVASVAAIQATLADRQHYAIKVFPGADHAIRIAAADGRRVLAPGYLELMASWLSRTLAAS